MFSSLSKMTALVMGIIGAILFSEGLLRVFSGQILTHSNFLEMEYASQNRHTPHVHHDQLGWAAPRDLDARVSFLAHPRSGSFERRTFMAFDSYGFRRNRMVLGATNISGRSPILALGDSFTLGSETNDNETWPAHLEELVQRRVFNGGFARYGLDQIFILLKELWPQIKPKEVIIGLTTSNILRVSETQRISHFYLDRFKKPFFQIDSSTGRLVLQNVPILKQTFSPKLKGLRSFLGYSLLAHFIFRNLAHQFWYGVPQREDLGRLGISQAEPGKLACLILRDILAYSKLNKGKVVVLLQDYYQPPSRNTAYHTTPILDQAKKCAVEMGLKVVDFRLTLSKLFYKDPYKYESLFFPFSHMTNVGNLTVAAELANFFNGQHENKNE